MLLPVNNQYDVSGLAVPATRMETVGGRLPKGRVGALLTKAVGERYMGLEEKLGGVDIVHAAELGYWFTAQAARFRARLGFRLVVTVWETLPFARAYRNLRTRPYREAVLGATDLFLPATERARAALLLEGDLPNGWRSHRPASTSTGSPRHGGRRRTPAASDPVDRSPRLGEGAPGRDPRARPSQGARECAVRLRIVGVGPEEKRLRAVAGDLGVADLVEFHGWIATTSCPRSTPRPRAWCSPRCRPRIGKSSSGWCWWRQWRPTRRSSPRTAAPSPRSLDPQETLFAAGDYLGLADRLEAGVLTRPPGARVAPEPDRLERFTRCRRRSAACRVPEAAVNPGRSAG